MSIYFLLPSMDSCLSVPIHKEAPVPDSWILAMYAMLHKACIISVIGNLSRVCVYLLGESYNKVLYCKTVS